QGSATLACAITTASVETRNSKLGTPADAPPHFSAGFQFRLGPAERAVTDGEPLMKSLSEYLQTAAAGLQKTRLKDLGVALCQGIFPQARLKLEPGAASSTPTHDLLILAPFKGVADHIDIRIRWRAGTLAWDVLNLDEARRQALPLVLRVGQSVLPV